MLPKINPQKKRPKPAPVKPFNNQPSSHALGPDLIDPWPTLPDKNLRPQPQCTVWHSQ